MNQEIRVIYPCGDRTKLAFGIMFDYEADDWCIAGRQSFAYTPDGEVCALAYGQALAEKFGLPLDCSCLDINEDNYLD